MISNLAFMILGATSVAMGWIAAEEQSQKRDILLMWIAALWLIAVMSIMLGPINA